MLCARRPKLLPGCAGAASSTGKPGLRRFGQGDAYSARCQTVIWGAPVHARATPPLAGLASPVTVVHESRKSHPGMVKQQCFARGGRG
jgi:hypothetical protein